MITESYNISTSKFHNFVDETDFFIEVDVLQPHWQHKVKYKDFEVFYLRDVQNSTF